MHWGSFRLGLSWGGTAGNKGWLQLWMGHMPLYSILGGVSQAADSVAFGGSGPGTTPVREHGEQA